MLVSALKTSAEIVQPAGPAERPAMVEFRRAPGRTAQLGRSLLNSAEVTGLDRRADLFDLLDGGLCGWRARPRAAWRWISAYLLATTTLPNPALSLPALFRLSHLGLIDNVFALSFIYAAFQRSRSSCWRTYFLAIPRRSRSRDHRRGQSLGALLQDLLPLVSPGILTVR